MPNVRDPWLHQVQRAEYLVPACLSQTGRLLWTVFPALGGLLVKHMKHKISRVRAGDCSASRVFTIELSPQNSKGGVRGQYCSKSQHWGQRPRRIPGAHWPASRLESEGQMRGSNETRWRVERHSVHKCTHAHTYKTTAVIILRVELIGCLHVAM